MLAVNQLQDHLIDLPESALFEIRRSKISLHHAKAGYYYPTIRLPHTFSKLAGLPTRIYQTVHEGALAFLVVVSKGAATENSAESAEIAKINPKMPVLTWRRSPVRIRPSPSFFLQSATLKPSIKPLSGTRIMAKKMHNEDKKLHNSDEELHNSHELDLSWQEAVDLQLEDENEDGSEIYYFVDLDGNTHSREFLSEELVPDDAEDLADLLKRKPSHVKVERLKPGTTDVVNLIPAAEKTPREIILPVPKSGARPVDIRISSEVAPDLLTKEESRQPSDVVDDDKRIIVHLSDGTGVNEATSVAQDRNAKPLAFSFSRTQPQLTSNSSEIEFSFEI